MADSSSSSSPPTLLSFSPDVLLAVLVRVPARDHRNLRLTCSSFREIVRSKAFCRERLLTECAETRVTFDDERYNNSNPLEEYDEADSYAGSVLIEAEILVDGVDAGKLQAWLIPRPPNQREFHRATRDELDDIGWDLCDAAGAPRHKSVREAGGAECKTGGFLFLKHFWIASEYRVNTFVGASAIRFFLCNTSVANLWTLAAYESHYYFQYEKQDLKLYKENWSNSDADVARRRRLETKCSKVDMRQFIRAGFRQVPEMIEENYVVFALPKFVSTGNGGIRMMSHDEAVGVPIVERPPLPEPPTGANRELAEMIKNAFDQRWRLNDKFAGKEDYSMHRQQKRVKRETGDGRDEVQRERDQLDTETKTKAAQFVRELGATVAESFALHYASSKLERYHLDMLLELVPPTKINDILNSLDDNGMTPLMHAARAPNWSGVYSAPELALNEWFQFCERLIDLGSSLTITNPINGKTALGCFRSNFRWHADGLVAGGRSVPESETNHVERMERLLKPMGGETEADRFDLPFLP